MRIENHRPRRLDDIMQRPRIPPVEKMRTQLKRIETRAHIRYHPKDQPERRPRLPHHHRHVLTRQPQRNHAHEVDHPVDRKRAASKGVRAVEDDVVRLRRVVERDLEGEGDEGVGERHEEVRGDGADPAPEDQLPLVEGWMALRGDELGVDGEEEGVAEEGDDDEVDQPDGCGGRGAGRVEGPKVVRAEADAGTESLWGYGDGFARDGVVGEDLLRPHAAKFGLDVGLEHAEDGHHVVVNRVLVAGLYVNDLARA